MHLDRISFQIPPKLVLIILTYAYESFDVTRLNMRSRVVATVVICPISGLQTNCGGRNYFMPELTAISHLKAELFQQPRKITA